MFPGIFMRVVVDQTTCKDLLDQFLKDHAPQLFPLPPSTTVVLMCDKINDASQSTRHGHDTGAPKDCSVFLDYHVSFAMAEVPTKRFTFKCFRPIEHQRYRVNPIVVMLARQSSQCILPDPRVRAVMTARDILYNDFRTYLKEQEVGFTSDDASSLGDEFIKHFTYALFPLTRSAWRQLNDPHNRHCAAPDPEFFVFFGRKVMGHKADLPCLVTVVQHLQDVWIGMGKVITKGNWPVVSPKLKNLANSIQKYAQRISNQAERQMQLINRDEPARTVETASNVSVIEALPLYSFLPSSLYHLNQSILNPNSNGLWLKIAIALLACLKCSPP